MLDWIPIAVSALALVGSGVALWKTHFSRFLPKWILGECVVRVYPIRNGAERWFIASLGVPIAVSNQGARAGAVRALRAKVSFPDLPITGNYDMFDARWEFSPTEAKVIDKERFQWLRLATGWTPFIVLPKATVSQLVVFEKRWNEPVVQDRMRIEVQAWTDRSDRWIALGEYELQLKASTWVSLEHGSGWHIPPRTDVAYGEPRSPEDLHRYTAPRDPLPPLRNHEPSYLDHPEVPS